MFADVKPIARSSVCTYQRRPCILSAGGSFNPNFLAAMSNAPSSASGSAEAPRGDAPMTICVKGPDDMMMWFGVTPAFTVHQVMLMIERVTGVPPTEQILTCKSHYLIPDQRLAFFNIQNNDTINLSLRLRGGGKGGKGVKGNVVDNWIGGVFEHTPMQIFVKTITGKTIALDVEKNYMLGDVKALIESKLGIDAREQLLGYQGRSLRQHSTLAELGISHGAALELSLQRRGGGGKGNKGSKGDGDCTHRMQWRGPVSRLARICVDGGVPFHQRIEVYIVFGAAVARNNPDMLPAFQTELNRIVNLGEALDGSAQMRAIEDGMIEMMHALETGRYRNNQG